MRLRLKKLIVCFIVVLTQASSVWADDAISVEHATVRATPPGQSNSAAFMTLTNASAHEVSLLSARSPVAAQVELHTHQHDQGIMRMRQVESIVLPARSSIALQPGGYHIMLLGLTAPLIAGEQTKIHLDFSNGESQTLMLPVMMPGGHGAGHHH
mgnify:CR=1 FL=1